MNQRILAVVIGVVLLWAVLNTGASPRPSPPVVPPDAPNFLEMFRRAIEARRVDRQTAIAHATALAEICHVAADQVEWDGTQEQPRINTARKFLEFRTLLRHFREESGSYSAIYEELGPTIQDYLTKKVGRDDQAGKDENTMTPALRKAYVDAYRDGLAAAFLFAAWEL